MKQRYNRLTRLAFPALIVLPALLHAAVISPDGTGNVTIASGYPGPSNSTIMASGGSDDDYTVSMPSGVTFTGDSVLRDGIIITSNNYKVENHGTFNTAGFGIRSSNVATINNYSGALIQGQSGGILFNGVGGTVNNNGTIRGEDGTLGSSIARILSVNGIEGGNGMTVNNYDTYNSNSVAVSGSTISGTFSGVVAGNNLVLLNEKLSTILGGTSGDSWLTAMSTGYVGIFTGNSARITNYGNISGSSDGIVFQGTAPGFASAPSIALVDEDMPLTSTVNNYGRITANNGTAIVGNSESQHITNYGGGYISGSNSLMFAMSDEPYSMRLGDGADVVSLRNDSYVRGSIDLGGGVDSLDFYGGALGYNDEVNLLEGGVYGAESINKSNAGLAQIGNHGDNYTVQSNSINVYGGSLYINGGVSSSSSFSAASIAIAPDYAPASITVGGGGEIGGTRTWLANININNGGISAGSSPFNGNYWDAYSTPAYVPPEQAIGILNIIGSLNFGSVYPVSLTASAEPTVQEVSTSNYLRVDIKPQSPILPGTNSDLITHQSSGLIAYPVSTSDSPVTSDGPLIPFGGQVNLTGANIVIAPTDINKTITNGEYKIIQSDRPIVGFNPSAPFGVTFESGVFDTGPFYATMGGYNNQGTVLGNFFTSAAVVPTGSGIDASIAAPILTNPTQLILTVEHDYEGLLGDLAGANGAAFGAALDAATQLDPENPGNALVQDFIAAMDYSSESAVLQAFQALDASASMAQADALVSSNYHLHRLTQDHLAMTRSQGAVVQSSPPTKDAKGAMIPGTTSTSNNRGNVWGDVSFDWKDNGTTGLEGDEFSFTAGVDYRVAPNLLLGFVFDGSTGDYDTANGTSDTDSLRFAAYGTYGGATGFYADFLLGYGMHDLDSDSDGRGLLPSGTNSSTEADSIQGMITVGYAMERGTLKHGPFAGLEYQNIDVDGYTQNGAMPVAVSGYDVDSLRGLIGYRAECTYGRFSPYMSVAYAHEFEDGSYSTTATLPNNLRYGVSGGSLESAFLISIGTGINLMPNLNMHVGYHGEISTNSDGTDSHGGTIGLNYSF